jgi:tetratricopeptide (TPR) repeat protein
MPQPLRLALLLFAGAGILGLIIYTLVRSIRRSEDPTRLVVNWAITLLMAGALIWFAKGGVNSFGGAFAVPLACLFVGVILSIIWTPSIGQILSGFMTGGLDGGSEELDAAPLYSTAEALRKRGKHRESIYAIQEQLRKFPNDFTGHMLLAEIQAEDLNDLQAAETTVQRFCAQPKHSPANLAFALNSLADWQLKFAQDRDAALRALEKIIELLPDSEFDRTAANRIAHLATTEQLVKAREPATVKMKHGVEYLGLLKSQEHLLPKEKGLKQEAAELVAQLDAHPQDHEARERLAIIYAREYGRLDFATDQIEQLVAMPNESPKHVARWLNLLADLQVEMTGKPELAEATLRRIVDLFPNQSQSQMALDRITSLGLELKRFETTSVVRFSPNDRAEKVS